jgi:hypothetical protein
MPPLRGSDPISIRAWLNDLTYAEVHAALWGAGLTLTGLFPVFVVLVAYAFGFNVFQYLDGVSKSDIPGQTLRQIRRQVHYFLVGGAVGVAAQWLGYGYDATRIIDGLLGSGLI